jgi:uncharacterized protein
MEAASTTGRPVDGPAAVIAVPSPPATDATWWPFASPLAWLPLLAIRLYQWTLSPLLGPTCRFEPSCSRYAAACLRRFGFVRGAYLAVRRIVRCHPFHPGGYDPPPARWLAPRGRAGCSGGS